ncbi:hypothetical protein [Ferrimonas balearica]|uniref:hypothetical protein n=1 Tax=Ferrimonas balearica TaxID=44012 RepID=UPI001F46504B|nr:hypothetical protein [Ferrimonas balearica]MBY6093821.1 hypothetical protein [Ferrimonas balearica]
MSICRCASHYGIFVDGHLVAVYHREQDAQDAAERADLWEYRIREVDGMIEPFELTLQDWGL